MVLIKKYNSKRKYLIKIFSDAKVLSSSFRKCFLSRLTERFSLYGYINNKITLLNNKTIEESVNMSELEIAEHKKFYELEKIDHISFDEFLDSLKVAFGEIYLFKVNELFPPSNFKKNEKLLAIINLEPDGDVDCIWVESNVGNDLFATLVEEYNNL